MGGVIVVYGPQGCGKTTNSAVLMQKLGCTSVVEMEAAGDLSALPPHTLVLTNEPIAGALDYAEVMGFSERNMEQKISDAIEVLRGSGLRGADINPEMRVWFRGYVKACEDIRRSVVEAAFSGELLPKRWVPRNERPERTPT